MIQIQGKTEKLVRAVRAVFSKRPAADVAEARKVLVAAINAGDLDRALKGYAARPTGTVTQVEAPASAQPALPRSASSRRPTPAAPDTVDAEVVEDGEATPAAPETVDAEVVEDGEG